MNDVSQQQSGADQGPSGGRLGDGQSLESASRRTQKKIKTLREVSRLFSHDWKMRRAVPIVLFALALLSATFSGIAASITVAWDVSTSTNLLGYRIYYRTSTNQAYVTAQNAYGLQHTITNLAWGTKYWIVARAVDSNGTESDNSNEVSGTTPRPEPPTNLRVITNALQGSSSPTGPWTNVVSYAVGLPFANETIFYRALLSLR